MVSSGVTSQETLLLPTPIAHG